MDTLPAVSSDKLLILLIAGGIFSLAGLWLMFRPQKEDDVAKLKIFGLEFQSSSAALLVFLIGAVFLVGGILLPEKVNGPGQTATASTGSTSSDDTSEVASNDAKTPKPIGAPAGSIAIEGQEQEPNNTTATANWIAPFSSTKGRYGEGDDKRDMFCISTAEHLGQELVIALSGYSAQIELQDRFGQRIAGRNGGYDVTLSISHKIEDDAYCMAVWSFAGGSKDYVLNVGFRS
jgi:hypothetical protein